MNVYDTEFWGSRLFASNSMASTVANAPIMVRTVKGLDYQNYAGLKAPTNVKLNNARTAAKSQPSRSFVVRSSERQNASGSLKKLGRTDAECEAAVVAGNVPEAPPVPPKPASPAGTPVVRSLPLQRRPRRNRRSASLRAAFQETNVSPANFVYPLFIHEGEEDAPIGAMPGCYRLGWRHGLVEEVFYLLLILFMHYVSFVKSIITSSKTS